MRRHSRNNRIAAKLMKYLIEHRAMAQADIAAALEVDKSFVSRVVAGERDLSTDQLQRIAESIQVPLGALLIDALKPSTPPVGKSKEIADLCQSLMRDADALVAEIRARRSPNFSKQPA
jgi:transcriptional regulator with XRE-family HTH domain